MSHPLSRHRKSIARILIVAALAVAAATPAGAAPPGFRAFDLSGSTIGVDDFLSADYAWTTPDGKTLYALAVTFEPRLALALNLSTGKVGATRLKPPRDKDVLIDMASIAKDGLRVTAWSTADLNLPTEDRSCYLVQWNVKSGSVTREIRLPKSDTDGYWVQDVDGDARLALLERRTEKDIRFRTWDFVSKKLSSEFVAPAETRVDGETHSAFSPDGKTIAVQSLDTILLIDSATMKEQAKLRILGKKAEVLQKPRFSPDSKVVAALVNDGADHIVLWDTESGMQRASIAARPFPKDKPHPLIKAHESLVKALTSSARLGKERREEELERLKEAEAVARRRSSRHCEQLSLGPFASSGREVVVGRTGQVAFFDCETAQAKQVLEIGRILDEAADAEFRRQFGQPLAPGSESQLYQEWIFDFMLLGQNERTLIVADMLLSPVAVFPLSPKNDGTAKKPPQK